MCIVVLAVLPASADPTAAAAAAAASGLAFDRHSEIFTPPGTSPRRWLAYSTTTGFCDCGTLIGHGERPRSSPESDDSAVDVASLVEKGWSKKKIRRWLRLKGEQAEARAQPRTEPEPETEIDRWRRFLLALDGTPRGFVWAWSPGRRLTVQRVDSLAGDSELLAALETAEEAVMVVLGVD